MEETRPIPMFTCMEKAFAGSVLPAIAEVQYNNQETHNNDTAEVASLLLNLREPKPLLVDPTPVCPLPPLFVPTKSSVSDESVSAGIHWPRDVLIPPIPPPPPPPPTTAISPFISVIHHLGALPGCITSPFALTRRGPRSRRAPRRGRIVLRCGDEDSTDDKADHDDNDEDYVVDEEEIEEEEEEDEVSFHQHVGGRSGSYSGSGACTDGMRLRRLGFYTLENVRRVFHLPEEAACQVCLGGMGSGSSCSSCSSRSPSPCVHLPPPPTPHRPLRSKQSSRDNKDIV